MSMNDQTMPDVRNRNGVSSSGWYPDPDDTGGLRFWDGSVWSEHRARLSAPTTGPAVCACGVAAVGRCRICTEPYCRAHISVVAVEDRPFRMRWEPWTCGNCIEDGQHDHRAAQLGRCESVAAQIAALPALREARTPNGKRLRLVNLFPHPRQPTERPPRVARTFLIEYNGRPPDPTFEGLALSTDGTIVFDLGRPVTGVARARFGPKRTISGFIVTNEIDLALLREAATRSTKDPWFEYAARSYLRAARHIGINPHLTAGEIAEPPSDVAEDAVGDIHSVEIDHDPAAAVQLQTVLQRQPDPPASPPLPLPHPQN